MDNFQKSVQKELEEIHQQKSAVQQMKSEIFKRLDGGKFYRDENRIVISAPQIVIGNVDYSGDLLGSMGEVIVKGSNVALEGVGSTGSITSRAPSIRQIAVNPGSDGQENVVEDLSEIVSQACDIVLQSDDAHGVFAESPVSAGQGGVRIHASSHMQIEAAVSSKKRKEEIEASVKALTSQISDMEKSMANQKKQVDGYFSYMEDLLKQNEKLNTDDLFTSSANTLELNNVSDQIEKTLPLLYQTSVDFIKTISALAEANRKKKALEKEKGAIKEGDDFKKNTTDADMTIAAEHINIATIDGDGNLHANPEAGISMRTPGLAISMLGDNGTTVENSSFSVLTENVAISTLKPSDKGKKQTATGSVKISSKDVSIAAIDFETEGEGKPFVEKQLTADGKVSITAKTVEVSTANPTNIKVDDKGKKTGGEYKAEGDVIIKSKTLTMESLDYEVKDGKLEKKALTKDSKLAIRTEKMDFMAADTARCRQHHDARIREDVRGLEVERHQEQETAGPERGDGTLCRQDVRGPAGRRQGRGTTRWRQRIGGRQQDSAIRRHHHQRQGRGQGRPQGTKGCYRQPRGEVVAQIAQHQRRHGHAWWRRWRQPERQTED